MVLYSDEGAEQTHDINCYAAGNGADNCLLWCLEDHFCTPELTSTTDNLHVGIDPCM